MVLFAFTGCGDSSTDDEKTDADNAVIDTPETSEEGTKSGASDMSLGLGNGDTYISRVDYTLLGDYYYTESYHIENEDSGDMTELGLDMYLTYDEENGYSNPDGVLAIYYDEETGEITGYEAYIGISPIRATVSYQVAINSTYYTCVCYDSSGIVTDVYWDNTVTYTETGETVYYTGHETYYSTGITERTYEERYNIGDDGVLAIYEIMTKEYDEDGSLTLDQIESFNENGELELLIESPVD